MRCWATEFYGKQLRLEQELSDLRGQALYDAVWDSVQPEWEEEFHNRLQSSYGVNGWHMVLRYPADQPRGSPPSNCDLRNWAKWFYVWQLRQCGLHLVSLRREVRDFERELRDLQGSALYDAVYGSVLEWAEGDFHRFFDADFGVAWQLLISFDAAEK